MRIYKLENYIQGELSFHIFDEQVINNSLPPHRHEFAEIVYIIDGFATQIINGISYDAYRGDMFFMNRNCTHSFKTSEQFTYFNICFSPETIVKRVIDRDNALDLLSLSALEEIQSEQTPIGRFTFDGHERILIEGILLDMYKEYNANNSERNAVLESYITILVAKLLRKMHTSHQNESRELSEVWRALSEFIDENLSQKLSLENLAQKCFYNPAYFSRAFKQKFGYSPIEYIARERSHKAATLLADDFNFSMEEIAEKCGFGDKSSLYRSFEKFYGCSPSEYRKSILKNKD